MIRLLLAAFLLSSLSACSSGSSSSKEQEKPPVIVVQAPPETSNQAVQPSDSTYPGLAWQTPKAQGQPTGDGTEASAEANPLAEPYDVVALLREFDAELTDAPKDQKGDAGFDDILSALAVADDNFLYGRLVTRAPMQGDDVREIRFWIEQDDGKKMVTVELKVGSAENPCELSDIKNPESQKVVTGCFWTGNAVDFRIPLSEIPQLIDTKAPFHVSGFQTCCLDPERNEPMDELEGAQGVWRVPGVASEVETK